MIGRISMEPYAGKARVPVRRAAHPIPRRDHVAPRDAESYAVALDPSGRLRWRSAHIDEVSVLVAPVADGSIGTPSLIDVATGTAPARPPKLISVEKRPGDVGWLRYRVGRRG